MNKMEFIAAIANSMGSTKSDAAKFLASYISVVIQELKKGGDVRLIGFGSFKVKHVPPKEVRNPQTGQKINLPATKRPKFVPGKELKEAVNSSKKK